MIVAAGLVQSGNAIAQDVVASPPASDFSISLGASMWGGDFGAPTETQISSVLLSARYRIGGLRLSASIPRMRIRSDGSLFTGINGTPLYVAPMVAPANRVRDGIGDVTLGASYLVPETSGLGFDLDLHGSVKLPTASKESQISTGKTDFSAGIGASKTFGRLTSSVSATYRFFGDTPTWNFHDGIEITAGGSYAVTDRSVLLLNYTYARAATALINDSSEIVGGFSTPLGGSQLRLTGYAAKGLSSGAADWSGGISVGFTF